MRRLAVVALCVAVAGLAPAQDTKANDPTGTWKCEYEIGGQKRESTLTVKRGGDKLVGTMSWPDQKEAKLADVRQKDGVLTFAADREREGQRFTVKYTVKVEGDTLKGKAEIDLGGESRSFDIEGKRAKAK